MNYELKIKIKNYGFILLSFLIFGLVFSNFAFAQENKLKVPENLIDKFFQGIKEAWQKALEIWQKIWGFFKNLWDSYIWPAIEYIWQRYIFPLLKFIWEKILNFLKNLWQKIWDFFSKIIWEKLKGLIK